jgi:hypothetical protein
MPSHPINLQVAGAGMFRVQRMFENRRKNA